MAHYFTKETDRYLQLFITSTSSDEKHKIFQDHIRPAFERLIESMLHVYGFYNIDDVETLKRDCLANLYEMIPKFNAAKGSKGFSYFNVIAKNWFIQRAKEKAKRSRMECELSSDPERESQTARSFQNFSMSPLEDSIEEKEFWVALQQRMDFWRSRLTKKTERQVLEAVIFLLRNSDQVTIYTKKAVYLYLRELTGLNTKQVVVNLKKIKSLYSEWREFFLENGDGNG